MRKLVLHAYCGVDFTDDDGKLVEAVWSETIDGVDLDLCEQHARLPVKVLRELLHKYGTKTGVIEREKRKYTKKPPAGAELICGEPTGENGEPCEFKAENNAGLGVHKRQAHGIVGKTNRARKD